MNDCTKIAQIAHCEFKKPAHSQAHPYEKSGKAYLFANAFLPPKIYFFFRNSSASIEWRFTDKQRVMYKDQHTNRVGGWWTKSPPI